MCIVSASWEPEAEGLLELRHSRPAWQHGKTLFPNQITHHPCIQIVKPEAIIILKCTGDWGHCLQFVSPKFSRETESGSVLNMPLEFVV